MRWSATTRSRACSGRPSPTLDAAPAAREAAAGARPGRLPEPFFDPRLIRDPLNLPVVLPDGAGNEPAARRRHRRLLVRGAGRLPRRRHSRLRFAAVARPCGGDRRRAGCRARPGPAALRMARPSPWCRTPAIPTARCWSSAAAAAPRRRAPPPRSRSAAPPCPGEVALVQPPELTPRQPYDAPRWIAATARPPGRAGRSGRLQGFGYSPGADLHSVPHRARPLHLAQPAAFGRISVTAARPGRSSTSVSRLDVSVTTLPAPLPLGAGPVLAAGPIGQQIGDPDRRAAAGRAALIVFGPERAAAALRHEAAGARRMRRVPGDMRAAIDPDSTIDLSDAHRFIALPNLAFFAGAGFPFTRHGRPVRHRRGAAGPADPAEMSVFLGLIGRLSAMSACRPPACRWCGRRRCPRCRRST